MSGKLTASECDPVAPIFGKNLPDDYRQILSLLARRNEERDGCISTQEIARAFGFQYAAWASPRMASLCRWGFAKKMGVAFNNGRCWSITEAGRRALDDGSAG